jgi:multicopper oxidase
LVGHVRQPAQQRPVTQPLQMVDPTAPPTLRQKLVMQPHPDIAQHQGNAHEQHTATACADGHPLTVIATDGTPIAPVEVDNLVLAVGERFDVLLKADQEGVSWIRVVTLDGNEARAVLRYAGTQAKEPEASGVRWGKRALLPGHMRSRGPVQLPEKAKEIALKLGGSMMPYRWSINEQFYPKADPIDLKQDEWVRMTFRNPTGMDHPFHLHGHSFYVLGRPDALNLKEPVQKDTVNVPAKSELVIQWQAKNPGRWFFHCHIEWHLEAGMARVIEIKPS